MKPYDKNLGQLKLIINKNIAITVFEIEKSTAALWNVSIITC